MGEVTLAILATTIGAIPIGISLWALLDAANRPEWAWALVGRRRVVWMTAILFGILTVVGGLVISSWYLGKVRPLLRATEDGDLTGL
jgi:hypothetical protein